MSEQYLKNIEFEAALKLADLVVYQQGQVVSRTLVQNNSVSVTLFSFDKGEGLSEHTAPFDAMVQILDGEMTLHLDGVVHEMKKGDTIIMPAGSLHALFAKERFKMLLTMIRG